MDHILLSARRDVKAEQRRGTLMVDAGKHYLVRQFIKLGVFVGGAGVESVPEEQGRAAVAKLEKSAAHTPATP
jgi:hypothetical protein